MERNDPVYGTLIRMPKGNEQSNGYPGYPASWWLIALSCLATMTALVFLAFITLVRADFWDLDWG